MSRAAVAAVGASGYFAAMHEERTSLEVTRRALVLGAGAALFLNLACPYSVLVLQNAGLTSDYIAAGAMMVFLLLVGLINPLLKVAFRAWALRTSELVVVYAMMVVASAIPTWGLVTNLCHILTRPFYYATPENRWAELIQPLIPFLARAARSRGCALLLRRAARRGWAFRGALGWCRLWLGAARWWRFTC